MCSEPENNGTIHEHRLNNVNISSVSVGYAVVVAVVVIVVGVGNGVLFAAHRECCINFHCDFSLMSCL